MMRSVWRIDREHTDFSPPARSARCLARISIQADELVTCSFESFRVVNLVPFLMVAVNCAQFDLRILQVDVF